MHCQHFFAQSYVPYSICHHNTASMYVKMVGLGVRRTKGMWIEGSMLLIGQSSRHAEGFQNSSSFKLHQLSLFPKVRSRRSQSNISHTMRSLTHHPKTTLGANPSLPRLTYQMRRNGTYQPPTPPPPPKSNAHVSRATRTMPVPPSTN